MHIKYIKKVLHDPIVKQSYKHYGKKFDIALGGGEPFLMDNLCGIVNEIENSLPGSLKAISTNGLLSGSIINFIKLNVSLNFKLNISIDGIGKIHDLIRGRKDAFKDTINTIVKVRKIKPAQKIELKLTLMPQNYDQITKVYKLADQLGCGFSFKPAENIKNYTNKIDTINLNFTKKQLCVIRNQAFSISEELYSKGYFKKAKFFQDMPFYLFSKRRPTRCSVLDNDITIMPDGACYSCIKMPSLGDLPNAPLDSIWSNRMAKSANDCDSCMLMCGAYKDYSGKYFDKKVANIETTVECNLNCEMCTQKELRERNRLNNRKAMNLRNFKQLIAKHKNITHVSFLGGEPFLNKCFFKMLDFLDAICVTYEITTNGTLVDNATVEKLKECAGLKKINFSLDGLRRYHDAERGNGVFLKCINAINLTKDDFNVNICSVMKNDNLEEIPKLSQYLINLGVRNQKIIYGMSFDKNKRKLTKDITKSENIHGPVIKGPAESYDRIAALFRRLNLLEKKYKISITFEPSLMKANLHDFLSEKIFNRQGITCSQLHNYRFDSKGRRIVCEFIRDAFDASVAYSYLQGGKFLPVCQRCCKLKLQ